jgi:hypothetical protein
MAAVALPVDATEIGFADAIGLSPRLFRCGNGVIKGDRKVIGGFASDIGVAGPIV